MKSDEYLFCFDVYAIFFRGCLGNSKFLKQLKTQLKYKQNHINFLG